MKRLLGTIIVAFIALFVVSCSGSRCETVKNDPLKARIYTLDNGLKVYMTVNKETPRIQTFIAVRVGAKNDPIETTGLAHYFEHLMFKGTEQFGTQNYAKEKPLLDQIEAKFEYYRTLKDSVERKKVYAQIDSLSYEASKLSIPNEYDKLMSAIGAKGTNAYTGYDMTVYVEDIPSNEIENWAKIQSDRFKHNVIRGFHTELEAVYEEKNMSLTNDFEKVIDQIFKGLYPHHPYGMQSVLGTQENLKNPSITNIKNYYKQWYVPNNMAICLSGDFDPDQMLETIKKYFGDMQPNKELKPLEVKKEAPIESPIIKEVKGLESPYISLAWGFPGISSKSSDTLVLLTNIIYNGKAGLIDLNVNQSQKVLSTAFFNYAQSDYSTLICIGEPKKGQTLEEVKAIIMEQIEKLKSGDFSEDLLKATINNYKVNKVMELERNSARADMFVQAFINGQKWEDVVGSLDRMSQLKKSDIVAFANRYLKNNYVQVNKLQGVDETIQKMPKPKITPILTNRDTSSAFLKEIQTSTVKPIEPVFVDFKKDMSVLKGKSDIEVLYKQNSTNDLFNMAYLFDFGSNADKLLPIAVDYLSYLGTDKYTPDQIKQKFYNLAINYVFNVKEESTTLSLLGLVENMKEGAALLEELIANAKPNDEVLANFKKDILKGRENAKAAQSVCFDRVENYIKYGPVNPATNILSNKEIEALTSQQLVDKIKEVFSYKHIALFYGPASEKDFLASFSEFHKVPEVLKPVPVNELIKEMEVKEGRVFIAPYDAKQIYMAGYSNRGERYNPDNTPIIRLYNEYFGSGMNTIVFQEMREARGLAYSAWAGYTIPDRKEKTYSYGTYIATQNDKMMDALKAFDQIINDMPKSESAFKIAKDNLISKLRTSRTIKDGVLFAFVRAREMGIDYDINKMIFEKAMNLTLEDISNFQQTFVKGRKYNIGILGNEKDLDLNSLSKASYGKIQKLSLSEIFGY
jgi:predicted Zn-dependent peptidase